MIVRFHCDPKKCPKYAFKGAVMYCLIPNKFHIFIRIKLFS